MRLSAITVDDLIHYLDTTDDRHFGWLERAHNYGKRKSRDYVNMLALELNTTKATITKHDIPVLTLYRGLETPFDDTRDGRHWTPIKNIAYDFGKYVYRAKVPNEMVDWVATIVHRIGHHHEQEITLLKDARPQVELVESMRFWIDVVNEIFD